MEAIACNHLNRGCRGALIGVPSTSSMTLSIMMVSDNFWDKEVALIGGCMLSTTDCCVDLGVKKLVICYLQFGGGKFTFSSFFRCTLPLICCSWSFASDLCYSPF